VELLLRLLHDGRPPSPGGRRDALKLRRDPGFPALLATVLSRLSPETFDSLAQRTRDSSGGTAVESAPDIDPSRPRS
jgi:hypothetical protein